MVTEIMGEKGKPYFPLIATLAFFIFVSNMLGLIPGFMPPTANLNTTAACAVIVFLLTHVIGLKEHGLGYIKQTGNSHYNYCSQDCSWHIIKKGC